MKDGADWFLFAGCCLPQVEQVLIHCWVEIFSIIEEALVSKQVKHLPAKLMV